MQYSSPARSLSESELLDYSGEHLRYEIWMFFESGIQLSKIPDPKDDEGTLQKNALVESFANHLRNLLLFLYPQRPKKNDVIAHYFFLDPIRDWKQMQPKQTETLKNALTKASQEVSHLTVLRRDSTDPSKRWPVIPLMKEVKRVLQVFVDNAPSTRLHNSTRDLVKSLDLDLRVSSQ